MDKKIIILIFLILIIRLFILYNKQENIDSTSTSLPLSNEAIQTISSVYNNQNFKATNIEATNTIKGKLIGDVSGNVTGNIIGNIIGNVAGDISGNNITTNKINMNNTGFVMWNQQIPWGRPSIVVATDPSGNTYSHDKWVLYAGGWGAHGIGDCATFSKDNIWYLRLWAVDHPTNNFLQVLAIPRGYFSNVFI